jgi:hypothetical protein
LRISAHEATRTISTLALNVLSARSEKTGVPDIKLILLLSNQARTHTIASFPDNTANSPDNTASSPDNTASSPASCDRTTT